MSKKWWISLSLITLILLMAGCAKQATNTHSPYEEREKSVVVEREQIVAPAAGSAKDEGATLPDADMQQTVQRKVIYNVSLSLIVRDTQSSFEQVRQIAGQMGGYVTTSNTWKENGQLRGWLTVRVPVESLEQALASLRALAVDIESENMTSQDVTEEYVDLESRLVAEQRTEQELLELLETRSSTGKTSDILEVHRELTQVRSRIEQIQGRMKYLSNLADMATIQVTLTPDALVQPVVVAGWRPEGTARDAVRLLLKTLQAFADIAIFAFLYLVPVLLVIAIAILIVIWIITLIWKGWKRRKTARAAK